MGIVAAEDRVLDQEGGFRTPEFDYDDLIVAHGNWGTDQLIGKIVGLVVMVACDYQPLHRHATPAARDCWAYVIEYAHVPYTDVLLASEITLLADAGARPSDWQSGVAHLPNGPSR